MHAADYPYSFLQIQKHFRDWKVVPNHPERIAVHVVLQMPFGNLATFIGVGRDLEEACSEVLKIASSSLEAKQEMEARQRHHMDTKEGRS